MTIFLALLIALFVLLAKRKPTKTTVQPIAQQEHDDKEFDALEDEIHDIEGTL
jgi:hypothetical protein